MSMLVISVLFTYDLPFERALASPLSTALNANESNTNATTSGSTNTTSATGAISENLSGTLGNATIALENATALATNATAAAANATRFAEQAGANATRVLTNVSRTAADVQLLLEEIKTNATRFNTTEQLEAFSSTISTSVGAITFLIVIPIIANMLLRYWQGRKLSEKGTNILPPSINQLYRVLVAIGVIFVVILIVAYLNSLIWFSTAQDQMDVVTNLLETQKNFLTIIGTAFASLVAFYFGTRGTQRSNTERTTAITGQKARSY
jgi:cellobiose-specific phosphotransferase system component IIC